MPIGFGDNVARRTFRKICEYLPETTRYALGDLFAKTVRPHYFGGKHFRRYDQAFRRSESFSREALEALQWEKFKRLLLHAYRHVKWYRRRFAEAGITPEDITCYADLPRIPILTKDDLRTHTDLLLADGVDRRRLLQRATGGSTGKPVAVYWDTPCYLGARAATVRWLKYGGVDEISDRHVWVKKGTYRKGSDGSDFFGMYYPTENELVISSTNMTPPVLREYVKRLRNFRPRAILGYTSGIYVLASYIYENKIDDIHVDVVQTSSDTLWPEYRRVIEAAFHGKAFDVYGMAERVCSASECDRHEGMHVDMELCLMETLDENGRQVFDKTGEIIGTNLENDAMPLIRYQVNDLGTLSTRKCSCGRESILLDDFVGRTTDMVTTPDGRQFRMVWIYDVGSSIPGVREFQFVQPSPDLLKVNMVKRQGVSEVDTSEFVQTVRRQVGEEIRIQIDFVDAIPTTRAGKKKLVVSQIAPHPVPPGDVVVSRNIKRPTET